MIPKDSTSLPKLSKTPANKYTVGQYVTRDDWVLLRVACVIEGEPNNPVYGLVRYGKKDFQWHTQWEMEDKKLYAMVPEFDKWEKVQPGDMVHVGVGNDNQYIRVLARIGDAVMLSTSPTSRKTRDQFDKLASQLDELTDGEITRDDLKEAMHMTDSITSAHKSASNWYTTTELALQHWELISEEEA